MKGSPMPTEIEERLQHLEQSNRRLKALAIACLLSAISVISMGAKVSSPKIVEAERFVLKDASGNERGQIFANEKVWGFVFFNEDGSRAASIAVSPEINALMLADHNGNMRQTITATLDESSWNVYRPGSELAQFQMSDNALGVALTARDRGNKPRVELGWSDKGSALGLSDSRGALRSAISGEGISFASFAKDGTLVWTPGWEKFSPEEQQQIRALIPKMPR
jgi:hypothetical protein